jgi:hypothetical protein
MKATIPSVSASGSELRECSVTRVSLGWYEDKKITLTTA